MQQQFIDTFVQGEENKNKDNMDTTNTKEYVKNVQYEYTNTFITGVYEQISNSINEYLLKQFKERTCVANKYIKFTQEENFWDTISYEEIIDCIYSTKNENKNDKNDKNDIAFIQQTSYLCNINTIEIIQKIKVALIGFVKLNTTNSTLLHDNYSIYNIIIEQNLCKINNSDTYFEKFISVCVISQQYKYINETTEVLKQSLLSLHSHISYKNSNTMNVCCSLWYLQQCIPQPPKKQKITDTSMIVSIQGILYTLQNYTIELKPQYKLLINIIRYIYNEYFIDTLYTISKDNINILNKYIKIQYKDIQNCKICCKDVITTDNSTLVPSIITVNDGLYSIIINILENNTIESFNNIEKHIEYCTIYHSQQLYTPVHCIIHIHIPILLNIVLYLKERSFILFDGILLKYLYMIGIFLQSFSDNLLLLEFSNFLQTIYKIFCDIRDGYIDGSFL